MNLILVGGFLGSGKTTAIVTACRELMERGKSVAVITNDQGNQQVDGLFVSSQEIKNFEVANGCFCCRFSELEKHLDSLLTTSIDYIFAESVGSCTDLIATVVKPLSKFKPHVKVCTNIFVDAGLIVSMLEGKNHFEDESIRYIFKKQLEEADILLVNKVDTIEAHQLRSVKQIIETDYSGKIFRYQNSNEKSDVQGWLAEINDFKTPSIRKSLTIDYVKYDDGERKMAWLDLTIRIETDFGNAHFIGREIIQSIFNSIMRERWFIGHLKFLLRTHSWIEKISFMSTSPSANFKIRNEETYSIQIVINARVQTEPELLETLVSQAIDSVSHQHPCRIIFEQQHSFKPGFPEPTHRFV